MPETPTYTRPDGRPVRVVQVDPTPTGTDPATPPAAGWATALGLGPVGAVVVLAGDDAALNDAQRPALTQLLSRGLVRTLREVVGQRGGGSRALCVVPACDNASAALLGQVMDGGDSTVSLLGLAPAPLLAEAGAAPLAGLSHLLTTPGPGWAETWRARASLLQALADARTADMAATPAATPKAGVTAAPAVRPVLLVIGGGPQTVAEVAQAVAGGWPVLLVEGSGGTADALARQFKAGQADAGSSQLIDILIDGRISCITLGAADGAADGMAEAALATALQRECGGTSVLRLAWQTFAALDQAAAAQQSDFGKVQAWILGLGLVVVAMSVGHALARTHGWGLWAYSLHYALIVAPISVSALIAVANRFSPGKRWVLLRAAAEALKREIYRYRVRPRQALADGLREKQLQKSMEDITRRLALTEVNAMACPLYTGPVPPANAVAANDDGLSLLGAEHYVRLRLSDQLAFYANKTTALERRAGSWQVVAIVVGALGTLLAALGDDWVSWVALTSAMASAAMAYLGYRQFETTLTGYHQTAADLGNLQGWWTALLPDERADPVNVDKLVTTTEQVLAAEQDGWAQNMTNALAALRTRQDEGQAAAAAAKTAPATKVQGAPQLDPKADTNADPLADPLGDPTADPTADRTADPQTDPKVAPKVDPQPDPAGR